MADSHLLGQKGEELAAGFLKDKGYKILFRNWTWGKYEIDIIAENTDFIVFAEVKTRSGDYYLPPSAAINSQKQKSIIFAADGYIRRYNVTKEGRFDVITIIDNNGSYEIDHIEDAFYPTLR